MRLAALALLLLCGAPAAQALTLFDAHGALAGAWQFKGLPAQTLPFTRYDSTVIDGRRALRVEARASYGHLAHALPPGTGAGRLAWSWRVDQGNERSDLTRKTGDDSPIKVCASFDMPEAQVPFVERQLLRLARVASGQSLPTATLCYVWDHRLPSGTWMANVYTERVRILVLRGRGSALARWESEQRDLDADFRRAFGDEAARTPALGTLLVSGDADNTGGHSLAYVADLVLRP